MRTMRSRRSSSAGSVLIIVLWVAFGLVTVSLYFAQSMNFEMRASENRVASLEAEQAIAGAARYVSNVLALAQTDLTQLDPRSYDHEAVPVGDARFWLIGRSDLPGFQDEPLFGLVDEASKLNLNTATFDMLQLLPGMTPELAAAIVDWRDADSETTPGGAEDEIYQRLNPPYRCKNEPFESVHELRLVYGMNLEILYGEDANLNGVLDANENDGDASFPYDNRDGRLDAGIFEYVTVFTREPNTGPNGEARVNVFGTDLQAMASLLEEHFDAERANEILMRAGLSGGGGRGAGGAPARSVLEFYMRSGMAQEEFALIEARLTASTNQFAEGLVNVNTASEAVLACIPGIGFEHAATLVSHRQSQRASLAENPSVAWVAEVLDEANATEAGPYLTGRGYQFTADIAAVGRHGRGYQRVRFVFDTSEGEPRVVYRQDLTHLGWALGRQTRNDLLLTTNAR
jgi:type II secretory pathway component PulK